MLSVMRFLKGKSSIMIYSQQENMRYRWYYVNTAEKNKKKIKKYIANQLKEDKISEQMTLKEIDPFKGERLTLARVSCKDHFSGNQQRSSLGGNEKPPAMPEEIYSYIKITLA